MNLIVIIIVIIIIIIIFTLLFNFISKVKGGLFTSVDKYIKDDEINLDDRIKHSINLISNVIYDVIQNDSGFFEANEEKMKQKYIDVIKANNDKYIKEKCLDFCDMYDIGIFNDDDDEDDDEDDEYCTNYNYKTYNNIIKQIVKSSDKKSTCDVIFNEILNNEIIKDDVIKYKLIFDKFIEFMKVMNINILSSINFKKNLGIIKLIFLSLIEFISICVYTKQFEYLTPINCISSIRDKAYNFVIELENNKVLRLKSYRYNYIKERKVNIEGNIDINLHYILKKIYNLNDREYGLFKKYLPKLYLSSIDYDYTGYSNNCLWFVMEKYSQIDFNKFKDMNYMEKYVRFIGTILKFLHKLNYYYFDWKIYNVMYNDNISDFVLVDFDINDINIIYQLGGIISTYQIFKMNFHINCINDLTQKIADHRTMYFLNIVHNDSEIRKKTSSDILNKYEKLYDDISKSTRFSKYDTYIAFIDIINIYDCIVNNQDINEYTRKIDSYKYSNFFDYSDQVAKKITEIDIEKNIIRYLNILINDYGLNELIDVQEKLS